MDLAQRVDIIELAQQDQARKWGLFVGDLGSGRTMMLEQEKEIMRKSIDGLYMRMQEVEGRLIVSQQSQGDQEGLEVSMRNMEERIVNHVDQVVQMREQAIEEKVMGIIDNQGKDIAMDFTELDRKVCELKEFVDGKFHETSSALMRLNESERHLSR